MTKAIAHTLDCDEIDDFVNFAERRGIIYDIMSYDRANPFRTWLLSEDQKVGYVQDNLPLEFNATLVIPIGGCLEKVFEEYRRHRQTASIIDSSTSEKSE